LKSWSEVIQGHRSCY